MNITQWNAYALPQVFETDVWSLLGEVNIHVTKVAKADAGLPLVEVFFKPSKCLCPPCQTLVTRKHTNSSGWMNFGGIGLVSTSPGELAVPIGGDEASCIGGLHEVVVSLAGYKTQVVHVQAIAQRTIDVHVQLLGNN
jgi:hypothetical protein